LFTTTPSFDRYLEALADQERGVNLPPNHVPSTFLFAYLRRPTSAVRMEGHMRTSRTRRTKPTVEHLLERFDHIAQTDVGYRKLTGAIRRAVRRLLALLDEKAHDQYMAVEQAMFARDAYCNDAVAQWAYSLGLRDGATPMPRVRVRKRAVRGITRLRKASRE
jgi:hypothetical protein